MVALVILGLVIAGYLQLLRGGHSLVAGSREWSAAVGAAVEGMERAKLAQPPLGAEADESLPDGSRRVTTVRPWQADLAVVTVSVRMPDGRRFDVSRLEPAPRPPGAAPARGSAAREPW